MEFAVNSFGTIPEARHALVKDHPKAEALSQSVFTGKLPGDDGFNIITAGRKLVRSTNLELDVLVTKVANYLRDECGVEPGTPREGGTKVMILSGNRLESVVAELATHEAGGTIVADYIDQPLKTLAFVLHDSETEIVFAENQGQVDRLLTLVRETHPVTIVHSRSNQRHIETRKLKLKRIITFEDVNVEGEGSELVTSLEQILEDSSDTLQFSNTNLSSKDVAAIVYTPESTGDQAGVLLTHGNLLANVAQGREAEMYHDKSVMGAILPFQHAYGRLTLLSGILSGARLCLPAVADRTKSVMDGKSIARDLRLFNSTVLTVVPAMLEGMMLNLRRQARQSPYVRKCLEHFVKTKEYVSPTDSIDPRSIWSFSEIGSSVTPSGTVRNTILSALGFRKLEKLIVGGAKLPLHLYRFFSELGEKFDILEGYGKTHFGPSTSCNRSGLNVPGTVGPPLTSDIEVTTDENNELWSRGPNVSPGYFRREALDYRDIDAAGWVRSHDTAVIDPLSKRIVIIGKTDEKIVLLNGKNYYPFALEDILVDSPYFDQALVIGDNTMYLGAIVTLNGEAINQWALDNEVELTGDPDVDGDLLRPLLRKEMKKIDRATIDEVSNKIRKVLVTTEPIFHNLFGLPLTLGERKALVLKHEADIDALYHDPNNRKFRFI